MDTQLSIVIPAMNEAENLSRLIPQTWHTVERIGCKTEIIVVVGSSTDQTATVARENGAIVVEQVSKGYGGALVEGFAAANGEYILTMDADLSHTPVFIGTLWAARETADVLIASR
jgi:dolichol-phosphate mannosyltransferase